jgi:hypothetical protein
MRAAIAAGAGDREIAACFAQFLPPGEATAGEAPSD